MYDDKSNSAITMHFIHENCIGNIIMAVTQEAIRKIKNMFLLFFITNCKTFVNKVTSTIT